MSALVALTAQNTTGVTAVHELPPDFIRAQLDAVHDDIGIDAAKTGMLFSRAVIDTVADFLEGRSIPLVVDPVMIASSGAELLQRDAVETLVSRLFPLATVVTPNLQEAEALVGDGPRRELAERIHELGAAAVVVTGGHGDEAVDHLFDGVRHVEIPGRSAMTRGPRTVRVAPIPPRSRRAWPRDCPSSRPRAMRRGSPLTRSGTGSPRSAPVTARSTSSI